MKKRYFLTIAHVLWLAIASIPYALCYPPAGFDYLDPTTATIGLEIIGMFNETITAVGPTNVSRSNPYDPGDGRIKIDTEIVSMNLAGTSVNIGPIVVIESPSKASNGTVQQLSRGVDFPANSSFSVFVEIQTTLSFPFRVLHNDDPVFMNAIIYAIPPLGSIYKSSPEPIPLKNEQDNIIGFIKHVSHRIEKKERFHYHCQADSHRDVSICTWPTDAEVLVKQIPYPCQQYSDMVFGTPDAAGNATITVPKDSYYSAPFFLKSLGPGVWAWCQVYSVGDGKGTLATKDNILDAFPISIVATGDSGNFTEQVTIGDDVYDPAGSCLLFMPLNMNVWLGKSETDPTQVVFLFKMNFPMWLTTGFIEARIVDTTPYPPGSVSMNGYYKNATGVPFNATTGAATLAGAGAGLDIWANIPLIGDVYTDYVFTDFEVLKVTPRGVGGVWIPVDELALLAPYIALASTIIVATTATTIYIKRVKHRREKQ